MRTTGAVLLAMWVSGCGRERPPCETMLLCMAAANPFLVPDATARYGPDGQCWREGGACEEECIDQLETLWVSTGFAACDPEPVTGEFVYSRGRFAEAYEAILCDAYEACTPARTCQDLDDPCPYGTFVPEQAELCLQSEPECIENYGYAYVRTAEACNRVCEYP